MERTLKNRFDTLVSWCAGPGQPVLAIIALLLTTLSSISSCRSASASRDSAEVAKSQAAAGRKIPFQTALYSAQLEQMAGYARASATYALAIRNASLDLTGDVFTPANARAQTDEQLRQAAIKVRPLIDAQARYQAEIQAMAPIWTSETQQLIGNSFNAARQAANCYLQLGAHTDEMNHAYWENLREILAQACVGPNTQTLVESYNSTVASTLGGMKTEMESTKSSVAQ